MVKLQYLNRKTEGTKLALVVAKDITKRIPPGLSSKSARRDPLVELDVSSKEINDEGATYICDALVKSVSHPDGNTRLEELRLHDNKLTASCLSNVAQVIEAASSDLQDLDLSSNAICIETEDHAKAWERFLRTLGGCYMLRRLDLSDNRLGSKAFEVLTKVYAQEEQEYIASLSGGRKRSSKNTNGLEDMTEAMGNARLDAEKGDETTEGNLIPQQKTNREEQEDPSTQIALRNRYCQTTGLRSIPYIVLKDCGLQDTCALYLSYVIDRHLLVNELLENVPPAKPGDHARQIEAYDAVDGCNGIIWKPNGTLSEIGVKVLQLAEVARVRSDELDDEEESAISARPRKRSDAASPFTPLVNRRRTRRDSASTANSTPQTTTTQRSLRSDPLRAARSRIQSNILRDFGPSSNDLWCSALKVLSIARPLLITSSEVDRSASEEPDTPAEVARPITPFAHNTISPEIRPVDMESTPPSMLDKSWPRLMSKPMEARPSNRNTVFKLEVNRRGEATLLPEVEDLRVDIPAPEEITEPEIVAPTKPRLQLPERVYRTNLVRGLTPEVWGQIVKYTAYAGDILAEVQYTQIVEYASRRETLRQEIETLGKPEHIQVWKVLEAMGCLAHL